MQNKDGTGVLFQSKEVKSDKHPTHSGTLQINGKEVKLTGWRKMSAKGTPYISLSFGEKQERQPGEDESEHPF